MKLSRALGFITVLVLAMVVLPPITATARDHRHKNRGQMIMPFLPLPPPILPMAGSISFGGSNWGARVYVSSVPAYGTALTVMDTAGAGTAAMAVATAMAVTENGYGYGSYPSYSGGYYPSYGGSYGNYRPMPFGIGGDGPPCAAYMRWQETGLR